MSRRVRGSRVLLVGVEGFTTGALIINCLYSFEGSLL